MPARKRPVITAVMVTTGRPSVARAVRDFQEQTYPAKRLLIVSDCPPAPHAFLKGFTRDRRITVLHTSGARTLGGLRNLALDHARGLTIQWDDDDWYGPQRMQAQYQGLARGKAAVLLTEQLHYFQDTGEVGWVVDRSGIEGTLLLDSRCGLRYPDLVRGEDTLLKHELARRGFIGLVPGGICYCRTYHGGNTWERQHHVERVQRLGLNRDQLKDRRPELAEAARLYGWRRDWKLLPER